MLITSRKSNLCLSSEVPLRTLTSVSMSRHRAKINDWSNNIIAAALKGLQSLNRPYKYAITVILMQKNGAGLVSAASTYWDTSTDGLCKVMWENAYMHCVVTVYGTALFPSKNVDTGAASDERATSAASSA